VKDEKLTKITKWIANFLAAVSGCRLESLAAKSSM
jgi:hypothetical protein